MVIKQNPEGTNLALNSNDYQNRQTVTQSLSMNVTRFAAVGYNPNKTGGQNSHRQINDPSKLIVTNYSKQQTEMTNHNGRINIYKK